MLGWCIYIYIYIYLSFQKQSHRVMLEKEGRNKPVFFHHHQVLCRDTVTYDTLLSIKQWWENFKKKEETRLLVLTWINRKDNIRMKLQIQLKASEKLMAAARGSCRKISPTTINGIGPEKIKRAFFKYNICIIMEKTW